MFVSFASLVFGVFCSAKMSSKKRKAEVDKQRKLDFFFAFESTSEIRPARIYRRCKWHSSWSHMDLPLLHFIQFLKKSRRSVTCKLATLIWCSSRSFTRQQIRIRLVSLTHQSYMVCITSQLILLCPTEIWFVHKCR